MIECTESYSLNFEVILFEVSKQPGSVCIVLSEGAVVEKHSLSKAAVNVTSVCHNSSFEQTHANTQRHII